MGLEIERDCDCKTWIVKSTEGKCVAYSKETCHCHTSEELEQASIFTLCVPDELAIAMIRDIQPHLKKLGRI